MKVSLKMLSVCTSAFCLFISCLLLSHCLHCQPFPPYFSPARSDHIFAWFPRLLKIVCEGILLHSLIMLAKMLCTCKMQRHCKKKKRGGEGGAGAVLIPPKWSKRLSWKLSFHTLSLPNFLANLFFLPHSSVRSWKGQNRKQHEMGVRLVKTMKQNE